MDYFTWSIFFLTFIQIPRSLALPRRHECSTCKPGYFASSLCSISKNTVCKPCPQGSYTSGWNTFLQCHQCSSCGDGLYKSKPCTKVSDTFCETCSVPSDTLQYITSCLGSDRPLRDQELSDGTENEDINFVEKGHDPSTMKEKQIVEEIGDFSGDDSGLTLENDKGLNEDKNVEVQNIADLDLTEGGSGYVLAVEPTEDAELSDLLGLSVTVEPDDAFKDELLPVGNIKSSTGPPGVHVVDLAAGEGSGLEIEDMTNASLNKDVQNIDLDFSGDGEIVLRYNDTHPTESIVVLNRNPSTTDNGLLGSDEGAHPAENLVEGQIAKGGMDGRTRTAVIVGVAVGAVVLFSLGFFVTRYCKKKKNFKTMKKLDTEEAKQAPNGTPEAIEFRGGRSGKYDPGAYESSPRPQQTESVVLLSSKPLINSQPSINQDKHVNGIDKMKYMDETTDEEGESATARDRLLPEDRTSKTEESEKGRNSLSSDVMNKFDDKLAPIEEERQPMLPKGKPDTQKSS